MKYCIQCGQLIDEEAYFCTNCGADQDIASGSFDAVNENDLTEPEEGKTEKVLDLTQLDSESGEITDAIAEIRARRAKQSSQVVASKSTAQSSEESVQGAEQPTAGKTVQPEGKQDVDEIKQSTSSQPLNQAEHSSEVRKSDKTDSSQVKQTQVLSNETVQAKQPQQVKQPIPGKQELEEGLDPVGKLEQVRRDYTNQPPKIDAATKKDAKLTAGFFTNYLQYLKTYIMNPQAVQTVDTGFFGYLSLVLLACLLSVTNVNLFREQAGNIIYEPTFGSTYQGQGLTFLDMLQLFGISVFILLGSFALIVFVHYLFINYVYKQSITVHQVVDSIAGPCSLALMYILGAALVTLILPMTIFLLTAIGIILLFLSLQIACFLLLIRFIPKEETSLNSFYSILISQAVVFLFLFFIANFFLLGLMS